MANEWWPLHGSRRVGVKLVPITDKAKDPYADFYGYMWYFRDEPTGEKATPVHFASGNGGNKIYVVPSRHLVIAITSSAYSTNYGQRRSQDILLDILSNAVPTDRRQNDVQ
jgi:CubicO group peptidase (beta-lactamase class C family)